VLVIPVFGREATPPAARAGNKVHIVQSGEVLSEIARRYGVDMQAILGANNLPNANALRVGQELIIPVATPTPAPSTATPTPETEAPSASPTPARETASPTPKSAPPGGGENAGVHIVQSGDTLVGIAKQYGVSVDALKAANPDVDPRTLRIGQRLVIPTGGTPPTLTAAPPTPSATAALAIAYAAPRLVAPDDGASFGGENQEIILQWAWDGQLGPDEWFDVQLAEKEGDFLGRTWTKEEQWKLPKDFFDGRWRWRIIVIRGVQGQSRDELSPPSEIRHIEWH